MALPAWPAVAIRMAGVGCVACSMPSVLPRPAHIPATSPRDSKPGVRYKGGGGGMAGRYECRLVSSWAEGVYRHPKMTQ
jgi:hypothetical protein